MKHIIMNIEDDIIKVKFIVNNLTEDNIREIESNTKYFVHEHWEDDELFSNWYNKKVLKKEKEISNDYSYLKGYSYHEGGCCSDCDGSDNE